MMTLNELVDTVNNVCYSENTELYFELPDGRIVEICNITLGENEEVILRGETPL